MQRRKVAWLLLAPWLLLSCSSAGSTEVPLSLRAVVLSAVGQTDVSLDVLLENRGATSAYVPRCFSVERRVGESWIEDPHLSGACISVVPDRIDAGGSASRVVVLRRSTLFAGSTETAVVRVIFLAAADSAYEHSSAVRVRTNAVTIR